MSCRILSSQGEITFESKKKMAVDENPFSYPVDVNMVVLNLDKFSLPRFKLVVNNGEDEPRRRAFETIEKKCSGKRVDEFIRQGIKTFRPQPQCPNLWHSYNPRVGRVILFNEMTRTQQRRFQRNYGQRMRKQQGVERLRATIKSKVANQTVFGDGYDEAKEASKEESIKEEYVGKSKFKCKRMMRKMMMLDD
ncbi:putative retroelement [Abeliophyllum distichum]|uniref:Retroelement n=1 Tax=Abeliophyllum distichum TaxID=126358 RepID=A0ABD1S9A3_9LAMI